MTRPASNAREEVLARIVGALAGPRALFREDATPRPDTPAPVTRAEGDALALARLFGKRLEAVSGSYELLDPGRVVARLIDLVTSWTLGGERRSGGGSGSNPVEVLSWAPDALAVSDIEEALAAAGISLVVPDDLHDPDCRARAAIPVVGITGVDAAFASTGSALLASAPGKSRAASLLPLHHIMLVPFGRIYPSLEAWLEVRRRDGRLEDLVREGSQIVFVTGPSKSADIELNLTLGVHGPRVVHALIFADAG